MIPCTRAKYAIFTKELNDLLKLFFFQKLQRVSQGRFQTYLEDVLEASGRVIWVPGGERRRACARNRKGLGGSRTFTKKNTVLFSCSLESKC